MPTEDEFSTCAVCGCDTAITVRCLTCSDRDADDAIDGDYDDDMDIGLIMGEECPDCEGRTFNILCPSCDGAIE